MDDFIPRCAHANLNVLPDTKSRSSSDWWRAFLLTLVVCLVLLTCSGLLALWVYRWYNMHLKTVKAHRSMRENVGYQQLAGVPLTHNIPGDLVDMKRAQQLTSSSSIEALLTKARFNKNPNIHTP